MDYLDDFLIGPQSDEYTWYYENEIPDPEWDRRCRGLDKLMLDN